MRIWIDADACPRDVKDVIFRAAQHRQVPVTLVANKAMFSPRSPLISMVVVPGGPDAADDRIASEALSGDIVITADIPLAARLVPRAVIVIGTRGEIYDEDTIGERLSVRDFLTEVRDLGGVTGGPAAFSPRDKQRFASTLDQALQRSHRP